jgi:phosphotriesterase-related protein
LATINSVLGPMDTSDMGFTLSHEHVLVTSAGIQYVYPEFIDREGTINRAVTEFKQAYSEGLRTIVDVTTIDLGRDIRMLEQVSRESGINIICATGTWRDIPRVFWSATPDMIAPLYIREIEEGIEGTGIKAAIIKVANDVGGVTPEGEIILRAAARAQKATGVPISTHTWAPERVGEQQVRIFEEEGVDLNRVYVGHSNDTTDTGYLIGLLEKGVWIGLDRYPGGRTPATPDWEGRTDTVKKLIDAGFGHRIMLGHDWSVTLSIASRQIQDDRQNYNPDGYLFITRKVLPRLRELGATEEQINQIMVDNPRRFFEGAH